jgi:hypothetical protein
VAGLNVDGAHPALNCLKSHEQRSSAAVTKGCDEQVVVPPLLRLRFRQHRHVPRFAHAARSSSCTSRLWALCA